MPIKKLTVIARAFSCLSFYWKLSLFFLVVIAGLGSYFLFVSAASFKSFFLESEQRLFWDLAVHYSPRIAPLLRGEPQFAAIEEVFYELKELNPRVEPFLLDSKGNVIAFAAPRQRLLRSAVPLEPIRIFIRSNPIFAGPVSNIDPFHATNKHYFSAALIPTGREPYFLYLLLSESHYEKTMEWLSMWYFSKGVAANLLLGILGAGAVGLLVFSALTRRYVRLLQAVEAFKRGDLKSRAEPLADDDVGRLCQAFNEMADSIEHSIDELAQTDQLRRNLVAAISHDLRGPIMSIQGFVSRFQQSHRQSLTAEAGRQVDAIERNIEHLARLVEQLFELAKLEAREGEPKCEVFSIAALVDDVAFRLEPKSQKKQATIRVVDGADDIEVSADLTMIDRVLTNLCDNALRYVPAGGEISIRIEPCADQNAERVLVSVRDTGCGIPADDLPKIFDRFYRVEKDRSKYSGGSGLGLAIVKKIIEAHGGEIQAESELGKGTIFRFDLPAAVLQRSDSVHRESDAHAGGAPR